MNTHHFGDLGIVHIFKISQIDDFLLPPRQFIQQSGDLKRRRFSYSSLRTTISSGENSISGLGRPLICNSRKCRLRSWFNTCCQPGGDTFDNQRSRRKSSSQKDPERHPPPTHHPAKAYGHNCTNPRTIPDGYRERRSYSPSGTCPTIPLNVQNITTSIQPTGRMPVLVAGSTPNDKNNF